MLCHTRELHLAIGVVVAFSSRKRDQGCDTRHLRLHWRLLQVMLQGRPTSYSVPDLLPQCVEPDAVPGSGAWTCQTQIKEEPQKQNKEEPQEESKEKPQKQNKKEP